MRTDPKARTVPREGIEREEKSLAKEQRYCIREPRKRKPVGWDESAVGAAGNGAPVVTLKRRVPIRRYELNRADLICRTAGYETRMSGGVGGGAVRLFPIPNRLM